VELDLYCFGVPLADVKRMAEEAEEMGLSGLWFAETKHNPYLGCALATTSTSRITVGTDIAVAFPRSPMVTAQVAWDLAAASEGRFILGLGTQVKGHVERRFSSAFDHPVSRLRDYVLSLRAIWNAFQGNGKLAYEGDFYSFSLLTEFFNPGPIAHPHVPVYVAGVNSLIAQMAGEVCDGFHIHPLHSTSYLESVIKPAIARGASRAGRDVSEVTLACPVFVIAGDSEAELEPQRRSVRRQISFYGSTRTYRPVFEVEEWDGVSDELHRLMGKGDLDAMEAVITDEMLDAFCVTASWDNLAGVLLKRYGGVVDRVIPYFEYTGWHDAPELRERWSAVAHTFAGSRIARHSPQVDGA